MIKYQFAYNSKNTIINVSDLSRETIDRKEKYICISCKSRIIPHLGKIRQKYFAHKPDSICSKETYLHNLAKNLFYQEFKKCLIDQKKPFNIEILKPKKCNATFKELGIMCDLGESIFKYNLTDYYSDIILEQKDDNFIPDLMLINKNKKDKIYIEIAVTHFSEAKKIESKVRLIELHIADETDLEPIRNHCISEMSSNSIFMNFNIKEDVGNHCNNKCRKKYDFFVIEDSGECNLYNKSLTKFKEDLNARNNKPVHYEISNPWADPYSKFRYLVSTFYTKGIKVQDCFLCRYHGEDKYYFDSYWSVFCKYLRIKDYTTKAASCSYFRAEKKYVDGHIADGERDLKMMKEFPTLDPIPDYRVRSNNPL